MAKHSYNPDHGIECKRCWNEGQRRTMQRANNSRTAQDTIKSKRRTRTQSASRSEQHAHYIDCGPQAWDDRD